MEIKNLIDHLNREIELFKDLISVLHKETECIAGRDYKGLYETVSVKEHLIMRINGALSIRGKLLKEALSAAGSTQGEATISALAGLAGKDASAIDSCQKTLYSLTTTVKEINRLNSVIIESSLDNVTKTLGFLGNFLQPSTYKPTGSFEGFALKGSRLSEGA